MKTAFARSPLYWFAVWSGPVVGLVFLGGTFSAGLEPAPFLLSLAVVSLAGLAWAVLGVHLRLSKGLTELREGLRGLRTGTNSLPRGLPILRKDDLGALAREVALVAGERNSSELRRLECEMLTAALTEAIPDALFRVDRDGLVLSYRAPEHETQLMPVAPPLGRTVSDCLPHSIASRVRDAVGGAFFEDAPQDLEFEHDVDGETHLYEGRVIRAGQNEAVVLIRDTTRQHRTASSRDRLHSILDRTLDPVITVTRSGIIQYVNPAGLELLSSNAEDVQDRNLGDFLPEWVRRQVFGVGIAAARQDGSWEGECAFLSKDGVEVPVSMIAISHPAPAGETELLSFVVRDLSERQKFDDHLSFLADHDPLTSLFSRRRFVHELGRAITRSHRSGAGGAVCVMDLDDFKYVNDSLGHQIGDRLLTTLSQVLTKTVRSEDIVARLDGNEFAILLAETQPSRVDYVAERLLKAVRNHFIQEGDQPIGVTASLGIAFYPDQGETAEELLAHADRGLNIAKERGGDQFVVFRPDSNWQAHVDSRLASERLIREAISRGRFVLHAQPIVRSGTNDVVQYEVLLRMLGEDGSLIYPGDFLGPAERYGLIRSVDRWVARQAIGILGRERKRGRRLALSVNLSGKSLGDLDFTMLIEEELRRNDVDASQLTLEITETAAIADTERAKIFVMALKQIGCRLALDDFGVGFSSMNHLKILPIDYLKIDGSFIRDLPKNKVDRHLVHAMVEVAKALRKRTVAEFVANDEILELVQAAGVDYVQGFHVGKPVPIESVLTAEDTRIPTPDAG